MRKALRYLIAIAAFGCLASAAGERRSWSKIRYVGGTVAIKTSPYDWNTTLTVKANPDSIVIVIAPGSVGGHQETIRLEPARISAVVSGPGAWQRVADLPGAHMPPKPATLFGLLQDRAWMAIFYEDDAGKPAGVLLDSSFVGDIGRILGVLTGKPLEYAK